MLAFLIFGIFAVMISALWYSLAFEEALQSRRLIEDTQALAFADFALGLYSAMDANFIDHDLSGGLTPGPDDRGVRAFQSEDFAFRNTRVDLSSLSLVDDCTGANEDLARSSDGTDGIHLAWVQEERAGSDGLHGLLLKKGGRLVYDETADRVREGRVTGVSVSTYAEALAEFRGTLFGSSDTSSPYYFYRGTDSCAMWIDAVNVVGGLENGATLDESRGNWENRVIVEAAQNVLIGALDARRRFGTGTGLSDDKFRLRSWVGCLRQDVIDDMNDGTIVNTAHTTLSGDGVGTRAEDRLICSHTDPGNPMVMVIWAEGAGATDVAGLRNGTLLASLNRVFPATARQFVRFAPLQLELNPSAEKILRIGGGVLPNQQDLYDALDVANETLAPGETSRTLRTLAFYAVAPLRLPPLLGSPVGPSWLDVVDRAAFISDIEHEEVVEDVSLARDYSLITLDCDTSRRSFDDLDAGVTVTYTQTGLLDTTTPETPTLSCYRESPSRGFGTVSIVQRTSGTLYNFLNFAGTQPRSWPYIPQWEGGQLGLRLGIVGSVAPAGNLTFTLSTSDIPAGDPGGSLASMVNVTGIDGKTIVIRGGFSTRGGPYELSDPLVAVPLSQQTRLTATPTAGTGHGRLQPGAHASVDIITDSMTRTQLVAAGTDLGFYPETVTVRQGDSVEVGVYNISTTPLPSSQIGGTTPALPAGVDLFFNTDDAIGSPDVVGGTPFAIPSIPGIDSTNMLIRVSHSTPPGVYTFDRILAAAPQNDMRAPFVLTVLNQPTFNFVQDTGTPPLAQRTWPFVYPYDVQDSTLADRTSAVDVPITLEMSGEASVDLTFTLSAKFDPGLSSTAVNFPTSLSIAQGDTKATGTVQMRPSAVRDFYDLDDTRASDQLGFTLTVAVDSLGARPGDTTTLDFVFVDDEITTSPANPRISIYPQILEVERGGIAFFTVSNTHSTAVINQHIYSALGTVLPSGVNIYRNRGTVGGSPSVRNGQRFRITLPTVTTTVPGVSPNPPTTVITPTLNPGEDILFLVAADGNAPLGDYPMSRDDPDATDNLSYLYTVSNGSLRENGTTDRVFMEGDGNNLKGTFQISVVAAGASAPRTRGVPIPEPAPVSFDFVTGGSPRTWPLVYPFNIDPALVLGDADMQSADAATRSPDVIQTITILLDKPADKDYNFALSANTSDIPSANRAPSSAYTVPRTLRITRGNMSGTADITLKPSALSAAPYNFYAATDFLTVFGVTFPDESAAPRRFNVVATPPAGISATLVDTLNFTFLNILGPRQEDHSGRARIYPATLEVEQGGTAHFLVTNISTNRTFNPTLTYPNITYIGTAPPAVNLPAGISLHFDTALPKTTADVVSGAPFEIPGPVGYSTIPVLVEASMTAALTTGTGTQMFPLSHEFIYGPGDLTQPYMQDGSNNWHFRRPFFIKVVPSTGPTLPPGPAPVSFDFVTGSTPRTWPYVYPYEIAATLLPGDAGYGLGPPSQRSPDQPHALTIRLDKPADKDYTFQLAASTTGIATAEQAPATAYTIPPSLTITTGTQSATVNITLKPSALAAAPHNFYAQANFILPGRGRTIPDEAVRSFNVVATPPAGLSPNLADSVRIAIVNDQSGQQVNEQSWARIYPTTVDVEQGGTASFIVHNRSSTQRRGATTLTYPINSSNPTPPPPAVNLPAGVSFHFNTHEPRAVPDVASGSPFTLPAPQSPGSTSIVLVAAAMSAATTTGAGIQLLPQANPWPYGSYQENVMEDGTQFVFLNAASPHIRILPAGSTPVAPVVPVVPTTPPTTFNFVTGTEERNWPYVYPYDIVATLPRFHADLSSTNAVTRSPSVTQTLTLRLDKPADKDYTFQLAASTTGIPAGEQAPSNSYVLATNSLTITNGSQSATANITLHPSALSATPINFYTIANFSSGSANRAVRRFNIVATPPAGLTADLVGSVEFALINDLGAAQGREIGLVAIYPPTIALEQGGTAAFIIYNKSARGPALASTTLTYPVDARMPPLGPAVNIPSPVNLPAGVSFHFNVSKPKASADVASGSPFALPTPQAYGALTRVLVEATSGAALTTPPAGLVLLPSSNPFGVGNARPIVKDSANPHVFITNTPRLRIVAPGSLARSSPLGRISSPR
ncbi:MAG: hypothetical protein OD811_01875 [Alphaproteobacteria bacterium]